MTLSASATSTTSGPREEEPADLQPDHHRHTAERGVAQAALVAAVHPDRFGAAAWTRRRGPGRAGVDHDMVWGPEDLVNDDVPQMREKRAKNAPRSATRVHIGRPVATRAIHKIIARTELPERPQRSVRTKIASR